jgi:hypothetical protein
MEKRTRFIEHQGKKILLVDFTNCSAEEMLTLLEKFRGLIKGEAQGSVLVLADFTGAQFDKAVITRIKELLVLDRPYVNRAAWVGTESLPSVYYDNFKSFSQRNLPSFNTREEAMEWLTS